MRRYLIEVDGTRYSVTVEEVAADRFRVSTGPGEVYTVDIIEDEDLSQTAITPAIVPGPVAPLAYHSRVGDLPPPVSVGPPNGAGAELKAPLPGVVVSLAVAPGDTVKRGQVVLTLETMKMQNPLKAPRDGVVAEIPVQVGQQVPYGAVLLRWRDA